jgi:Cft2 family RNA processing exonuclease
VLYQHRYGPRQTRPMPFGESLDWNGIRLTTHPAGHVLGSAMLLVDDGRQKLLYTGDFKLGESATAERAEPPQADILVMETTFGDPFYKLPPREKAIEQLLFVVEQALARDSTPVVQAYTLGKSQEVTKILTSRGYRVLQHPLIYAVSRKYEECGCDLGDYDLYETPPQGREVVITTPRRQKAARLTGMAKTVSIAVTGWAMESAARFRLGVDYAIPLSDHAGYDELLECIERVNPREILCTHGPEQFVDRLQALGHNARLLKPEGQLRLF